MASERQMVKLYAAFLSGCMEENVFASYFPFLANVLVASGVREVRAEKVREDFENRYGFSLPLSFVRSVLNVGVQKGLIRHDKKHGRYVLSNDGLDKWIFNPDQFNAQWAKLITSFSDYLYEQDIGTLPDEIDAIIAKCIEVYDDEVLPLNGDVSTVDNDDKLRFIWNTFVLRIHTTDSNLYDFVATLYLCNVIKDANFFEGDARSSFAGLKVYLDTPIAFSLIGLDEPPRIELCRYLVKQLKEAGCQVMIFEHCLQEMERIIQSANHWVHSQDYRIDKASRAARYFFDNRKSREEVTIVLESLEDRLSDFGVKVDDFSLRIGEELYREEELRLYEMLKQKYSSRGREIDEHVQKSILVDIRSMIFVLRNRKGFHPNHLYSAGNLLVTLNFALTAVSGEYAAIKRLGVPACISVDLLSSVLWLHSPVKLANYKKVQLLADCYVATSPSPELLKKYVIALTKARANGVISEKKFIQLKTSSIVRRPLAYVANVDGFNEESLFDVVQRMEDENRFNVNKEVEAAKKKGDAEFQAYKAVVAKQLADVQSRAASQLRLKDEEISKQSVLAISNAQRADEMERLVSSTAAINAKLISIITSVTAFLLLFILIAIPFGFILGRVDFWTKYTPDNRIVNCALRGCVALATEIIMLLVKKVRVLIEYPIRMLIKKIFLH